MQNGFPVPENIKRIETMKKKIYLVGLLLFAVITNIITIIYPVNRTESFLQLQMTVSAKSDLFMTLYFSRTGEEKNSFRENASYSVEYKGKGKAQKVTFDMSSLTTGLRFDPANKKTADIEISDITLLFNGKPVDTLSFDEGSAEKIHDIDIEGSTYTTTSDDGYMIIPYTIPEDVDQKLLDDFNARELAKKIACCIAIDFVVLVFLWKRKQAMEVPKEVYYNRKLVFNLAKNDFKSKFAGSYLGIVWAFVQPIVTVLIYWFVFEKALHAGGQSTKAGLAVPFVVWLVAGMVPWFYHQDVVISGTNVLFEYSYLVKKVVFNISTLPVVKAVSAIFVNVFFIAFGLVLCTAYGFYPSVYTLQIVYYLFCLMVLSLGVVYITCAAVVFFRDLSQIISILLQVMNWFTPIMWNYDGMSLSKPLDLLIKANPLFYIVQGYRDSLLNKVWFFEHGTMTVYFWFVTSMLFILGTTIFRRLKPHFADVL